jgi:hypothetical protein
MFLFSMLCVHTSGAFVCVPPLIDVLKVSKVSVSD